MYQNVYGCNQSLIPGSLKNRSMEFNNDVMLSELLAIHSWGQPMDYFYDSKCSSGEVEEQSRT